MRQAHVVRRALALALPACLALTLALPAVAQRNRPAGPRLEQRREAREEFREKRDEVVQFIRETFPEKAAQLEELRRRNPAEFERRRAKLVEEVRRLMELKGENPERYRIQVEEMRLRDELNRLAREARRERAGSQERLGMEKRLKEAVQHSFDLRQQIKQAELEDLRVRLKELEVSLERRAARRAQMIEERTQQMLGAGEEDW